MYFMFCRITMFYSEQKCSKNSLKEQTELLLQVEPTTLWLTEEYNDQTKKPTARALDKCGSIDEPQTVTAYLEQYSVSPVSFIGEQSVERFGDKARPFFPTNTSAITSGLDSPGGYLHLKTNALCRIASESGDDSSNLDPSAAISLKLAIRVS